MGTFKFKNWKAIACCVAGLLGARLDGNEWTNPYELDQGDAAFGNYTTPSVEIAVNSSGQAAAAWKEFFAAGQANVKAAYFDGFVWSSAVDVSPPIAPASANRLSVSINESGIASVTWQDSVAQEMFLSIYSNGSWSAPIQVSTTTVNLGNAPVTNGIDADGNILVVWVNGPSPTETIFARQFNSSGIALSGEVALSSPAEETVGQTAFKVFQFSMNNNGEAMYVWGGGAAVGSTVMKYAYFDGTTWTITNQTFYATPGNYQSISVDLNDSGLAAATWVDATVVPGSFLNAVSFYDGSAWSAPIYLDSSTIGMTLTQIGIDADGNCLAVWQNQTVVGPPPQYDLKSQYYSKRTNTWKTPTLHASPAFDAVLEMNTRGNALLSWSAGFATPDITTDVGILQASLFQNKQWLAPATISSTAGKARASGLSYSDGGIGAIGWRFGVDAMTPVLIQTAFFSNALYGKQVANTFPSQIDYVNTLEWPKIWSPASFLYYSITRNGVPIAQVPSSSAPYFEDHHQTKGAAYTYTITGITSGGPSVTYTVSF